jgi:hypothetical protein
MEVAALHTFTRIQGERQDMAESLLFRLSGESMGQPPSEVVSLTRRILENILFLESVFALSADEEIPDVPFLELARSFQLKERQGAFRVAH